MFGAQGLAPEPGQGPGPGLTKQKSTKKKDKDKASNQQQQSIDWSARMIDMKRINTLIRSKEEEDAYWMKLRNTNHDYSLDRDDGDDDGNLPRILTNISHLYSYILIPTHLSTHLINNTQY